MTRKEILEKIRGERFKAFNRAEELEKEIMEKCPDIFLQWLELEKYKDNLKEIQEEVLSEAIEEKADPYMRSNIDLVLKEIISDDFHDKFGKIFNSYLDGEMKQAYDSFLSKKGIVNKLLSFRTKLNELEIDVKKIYSDAFESWEKDNPDLTFREKFKVINKLKKEAEEIARKRIEKLLEGVEVDSTKELLESIMISESLIEKVGNYVEKKMIIRIRHITQEHHIVSEILKKVVSQRKEDGIE